MIITILVFGQNLVAKKNDVAVMGMMPDVVSYFTAYHQILLPSSSDDLLCLHSSPSVCIVRSPQSALSPYDDCVVFVLRTRKDTSLHTPYPPYLQSRLAASLFLGLPRVPAERSLASARGFFNIILFFGSFLGQRDGRWSSAVSILVWSCGRSAQSLSPAPFFLFSFAGSLCCSRLVLPPSMWGRGPSVNDHRSGVPDVPEYSFYSL